MTLLATQYLALQPTRLPDATMFHLPGGLFVVAQEDDQGHGWQVRSGVGHDRPGWLVQRGLTRAAAETLAHAVRLVRLAELDAAGVAS